MQSIQSYNWRQFLRPMAAGAALVLGITAFGAALPAAAATSDRTVGSDEFAAPLYRVLKNDYDLDGDGSLTVGELRSITSLDLSDSGLSSLDGIEYLTGLTYLDLSDNNLTSLAQLENCDELEYLDVSGNRLTSLDDLSDSNGAFTNLLELDVSDNRLTSMSGAIVCTNLTSLDLSGNRLSSVGSGIYLMRDLTSLDLSDNSLTEITATLPSSLTSLSLSGNSISDLSFLSGLTNLTYLDVSNNGITSVSSLPLTNQLKDLYLNNNKLTTLGDLVGLTNCRIDVSRNNIDTYSTTEQQYSEDLRLSGNAVTAVPQNRSGWQYQNGAVYYFTDAEGHYVTGTTTIDGETYTFSSLGVLDGTEELEPVTQDEGEEDSTPTLPSGTDENPIPGSWQLSGGEYYLVDDSGRMLTGWQKYDTAWYYMDESGVMQTDWLQLGDTWYYLYDWGGMATGR